MEADVSSVILSPVKYLPFSTLEVFPTSVVTIL